MNGLPYYKRYPRDIFEGTIGMPLDLKGPYSLVLDLIYAQNGQLPDDARYISGALGCSVRRWNVVREKLIATGKIVVTNGHLGNYRADKELITSHSFQDKQRQNASSFNKNNDISNELAKPKASQPEPEPEKKDSVAYATGGDAADQDFAKDVFERGVLYLLRHGHAERNARSVIGKWRKDHTDREIFDAFSAASRESVIDPVAWIAARLGAPPSATNLDDLFRKAKEVIR